MWPLDTCAIAARYWCGGTRARRSAYNGYFFERTPATSLSNTQTFSRMIDLFVTAASCLVAHGRKRAQLAGCSAGESPPSNPPSPLHWMRPGRSTPTSAPRMQGFYNNNNVFYDNSAHSRLLDLDIFT